jgi:hypothetical protein
MHGRPGVHCIRLAAHLLCMETRFRGRRVESAADDSERIKSVSTPRIIPCPPLDLLLPLLQIKSHSFLHTPAKNPSITIHNTTHPTRHRARAGSAASGAMAPVILEMDVHCLRCARKAVRNMHGTYYVSCWPAGRRCSACSVVV